MANDGERTEGWDAHFAASGAGWLRHRRTSQPDERLVGILAGKVSDQADTMGADSSSAPGRSDSGRRAARVKKGRRKCIICKRMRAWVGQKWCVGCRLRATAEKLRGNINPAPHRET